MESDPLDIEDNYVEHQLTPQQEEVVGHICHSTDTVSAVDASAGTGKTFTLIRAVLTLIRNDWEASQQEQGVTKRLNIDDFILITFTNKAADELEKKLYNNLFNLCANHPKGEEALWAQQLERLSGAFIGTIHSFCKGKILREFGYDVGVAREAGATFSAHLLHEAIEEVMEAYLGGTLGDLVFGCPDDERIVSILQRADGRYLFDAEQRLDQHEFRGRVRKAITLAHNRGLSSEVVLEQTVHAQASSERGYEARCLFTVFVRMADVLYQRKKDGEQVIDQFDMLDRAVRLIEGTEGGVDVASLIAQRYRYLFIDEFQDTDRLQKRLVDAFVPVFDGIVVVGDWKQSIYRFRGAEPELLEELARDYMASGTPLQLTVSSRPSEPLRQTINALFSSVGQRFPQLDREMAPWKTLWQPRDDIPTFVFAGASTDDPGAQGGRTVRAITYLQGERWHPRSGDEKQVELGDIVVLCRTNDDVAHYTCVLVDADIDARANNAQPFYRQPEIVAVYRMLRLVLNDSNASALVAALPTAFLRNVNLTERVSEAIQYSVPEDHFLIDKFARDYPEILSQSGTDAGILNRLRRSVRTDTASQVLDRLYSEFDILDYYRSRGQTGAVQNLQRLREVARTLASDDQVLTLRSFARYLRRAIDSGQDETQVMSDLSDDERGEDSTTFVRVMTIHQAKGLEFPFVIIPEVQRTLVSESGWKPDMILTEDRGLDVAVYPDFSGAPDTRSRAFDADLSSNKARDVREEMRVFYVAVTRAQHSVFLIGDDNQAAYESQPGALFGPSDELRVDECSWQDEILHAYEDLKALEADADTNIRVMYSPHP